jgi:hypothetical protein
LGIAISRSIRGHAEKITGLISSASARNRTLQNEADGAEKIRAWIYFPSRRC